MEALNIILVAGAAGGFLGWVAGGVFNLINGRSWSGK